MSRLIVVYDPLGNLEFRPIMPDHYKPRIAQIDVADGLAGKDIYEIARKLAEMLLEQVDK